MKKFPVLSLIFLCTIYSAGSQSIYSPIKTDGVYIHFLDETNKPYFKPLEDIRIGLSEPVKEIRIFDGRGIEYFTNSANPEIIFKAGGALGRQTIKAYDKKGNLIDEAVFFTNAHTEINDDSGHYNKLLKTLYWTMVGDWGETEIWRVNGKFYYTFVRWLRDHVHTLKGMKYFYPELKSGIDLYADTQRKDGMIWDNIYPRSGEKNWWNRRFDYGNFIEEIEDGKYEMKRIPIENDVEYLFLEGLYYTWKATGDDAWMNSHLDQAMKAVNYSTTDPYRWSEKYNLLKRGFTIDTWDFQSDEDAALVDGYDIMRVEPGKTRFGIMYGDNTGMAAGCKYLGEMLDHSGRLEEAARIRDLGKTLQERIDRLSWNGNFYTHHIPEDPAVIRDLGVDQSKQISLSNAYSINRTIRHDQSAAIIRSYMNIRKIMPSTSPGEWYTIFPPFEKGFGNRDSSKKWQYMNGGVTPIVAGELAHGAFENGFERYGVDILDRLMDLASETNDYLHCTYAGKMPEKPNRSFTTMDIVKSLNSVYPSKEAKSDGKPFFDADGKIDSQDKIFSEIPFRIINPGNNKYTAMEISGQGDLESKISLPVNRLAASLYLLHGTQKLGLMGSVTLRYADGSAFTEYIDDQKIGFWWDHPDESRPKDANTVKAWRSNNEFYEAAYIHGINNPNPEKMIVSIDLAGMKNGTLWEIMAITLSDYPVFFEPSIISWGIPDNWGSAAVVYALIEGLSGIKDTGIAFNRVTLSPRWVETTVSDVNVTAKYEASGGYLSYSFSYDRVNNKIGIWFTGNGNAARLRMMLPEGKTAEKLLVDDRESQVNIEKVEDSDYLVYDTDKSGVYHIIISLK